MGEVGLGSSDFVNLGHQLGVLGSLLVKIPLVLFLSGFLFNKLERANKLFVLLDDIS